MGSFQEKEGWKGCEKQKIKIIVPFRSYPALNKKLKKKQQKNSKN